MAPTLDDLLKKRRTIQNQVKQFQTAVNSHAATPLSVNLARAYLVTVRKQEQECQANMEAIGLITTDDEDAIHEPIFNEIMSKLLGFEAFFNDIIDAAPSTNATGAGPSGGSHTNPPEPTQVRLPNIELPKFQGDINEWMAFRDLFTAAIHSNQKLSDAQKLTYLKSTLSGGASQLLSSMASTDANYTIAWDTLKNRFENKREQVFAILKKFVDQPSMKGECATTLRKLIDISNACRRSLEVLQVPVQHWDAIIVFTMLQKLDSATRQFWELSLVDTELPNLQAFVDFLEQRARALAAGGLSKSTDTRRHINQSGSHENGKVMAHQANLTECIVCSGTHSIHRCEQFKSMDIPTRVDTIKKAGMCFNCLHTGHIVSKCTSKYSCKVCKGKHNTLLHLNKSNGQSDPEPAPSTQRTFHSINKINLGQGMLATAMVKLRDQVNRPHLKRAFLDSGSTTSFITEACVKHLGLQRSHSTATVTGLGSTSVGRTKGTVIVDVQPYFHTPGDETFQIEMMILQSITDDLPAHPCNPSDWPYLQNLQLADPYFNKPEKIDILLGADVFWDILMDGKKRGGPGTPIAQNSKLGWLVAGQTNLKAPQIRVHHTDVDLDQRLQTFWELESVPKTRLWKKEEKQAEEHFQSTATRGNDGTFTVSLPFKSTKPNLGATRDIAMKRLLSLERRLRSNPQHKQAYLSFMDEYQKLGHMELVEEKSDLNKSNNPIVPYYIPHHFVLKESSTTTKFRVVFDASCKSSTGVSLNDELMVGPTIQDNLICTLMRFRTHVVALTADIAKMYRQIRVTSPHTDFQRILWRSNPMDDVREYRLLTVTYGTASAPFHATRVLKQLALDEQDSLPIASLMALRDFYVDDLMSGTSTTRRAIEAFEQLVELARRGGFELRKWWSNDPDLLAAIPEELRETQQQLNLDKDDLVKTLGLHWNPGQDKFTFKVHLTPLVSNRTTKRCFLSEMAKVFDPLGWLAPVIIRGKILFQLVWKSGIDWDDALPDEIMERWTTFRGQLHAIEKLNIPRCIKPDMTTQMSLHGFCDASERAYAAVVYTKAQQHNGTPVISLVAAKTRVAPSNPISLPRLELCGALLLSKTMTTVQDSLQLSFTEVNAWSDSTVVLAWIRGDSSRWKTFVANRVTEIQENIPIQSWGHVDGTMNPADCASRGIGPEELENHHLWWSGPDWLKEDVPEPGSTGTKLGPIAFAQVEEERKTGFTATVRVKKDLTILTNSSTLLRLKRVTAWLFRFFFNCRSSVAAKREGTKALGTKYQVPSQLVLNTGHSPIKREGPLSTSEIEHALMSWVKVVQIDEFRSEMQDLKKKKLIQPTSQFRSLNLWLDASGILRVGGRLQNAPISEDRKTPILIPRHHPLTYLIIQNEHKVTLHGGTQIALNAVQRRFWIPRAKEAVRHQLKKCVICCRYRGSTMKQIMGSLPGSRVTPNRPFLVCGVDYAGPFVLRAIPGKSKVTFKAYLALFICFSTHAVHLEVVSSMSTDAFLASLRRFIGRRGRCREIYSDCGTNFVGASRELKEWLAITNSTPHNQRVSSELSTEGIQWHFNPPGAPHFGGLWEAGVKSVKHHLYRVMGGSRLTFEEMTTYMVQIEACLNSRPLTPVSTDPDDLLALTAGHFLIGDSLLAIPEPDLTNEKENRLTRWQHVQQLTQHFWRRWSREYLTRLQQRPKWHERRAECKIGDMVLIKEDNLPPLKWRLGRIVSTHPGRDGLIRVATIKTAEGEIKRPIVKLCLLPVDDSTKNDVI